MDNETKELVNQLASAYVQEYMFLQKKFKTMEIVESLPVKHIGIDFDKAEFGDKDKDYVYETVDDAIRKYASKYGYDHDSHGVWRQANKSEDGENYDDCDGVLPDPENTLSSFIADEDDDEKEGTKLAPPFDNYVKKLRALLGQDPDVTVLSDSKAKAINICVAGCDKPSAFRLFFPGKINVKGVGDITVLINGHKKSHETTCDETVLHEMFANNPIVEDIVVTHFNNGGENRLFVIFKNQTIQFKNDNFGSLYGVTTTTPEALAKEVLNNKKMVIWYMTDSEFAPEDNDIEDL